MDELNAKIIFASMLVQLGKATIEEVRALFAKDHDDDAILAGIMSQVESRLQRRG